MDFIRVLFTIILYLNIPIVLAMFFFAYVLLCRSRGNAIYFNFGLCILFLGWWSLITFLTFFENTVIPTVTFALLSYVAGLWVMHYFLFFTYRFPVQLRVNRLRDSLLYIFSLVLTLSFFIPKMYVLEARVDFPFLLEKSNYIGLSIFTAYLTFLAFLAFKNLIQRYFKSDGIHKIYLKKITIGTLTAVVITMFFSLVVLYFGDFDFTYIGVLSTFTVLVYIYSILFSKKMI